MTLLELPTSMASNIKINLLLESAFAGSANILGKLENRIKPSTDWQPVKHEILASHGFPVIICRPGFLLSFRIEA
jgi:hypothetical protein